MSATEHELHDIPGAPPRNDGSHDAEEAVAGGEVWTTREDWLHAAVRLAEEPLEVEGIGRILISEISAAARAQIVSAQTKGILKDTGKEIDRYAYETQLLVAGVVDPRSDVDHRQPLFRPDDAPRIMAKLGSSKIEPIIDTIERLSHLGKYGASAEGNFAGTLNGAGTSG